MAVTLQDWINRVSEHISQPLTGDDLEVKRSEVVANLIIGYKLVVNAIVATNEGYYGQETKANLVADQSVYSLPSDCRKVSRLEVGYASSTDYSRAQKLDRNAINDPQTSFSTIAPYYSIIGNNFELFPTPGDNVTDGLKLFIIEEPDNLTQNSDEPDLPIGYEYLPPLFAASLALLKIGDEAQADRLMSTFNAGIGDMKQETPERDQSDTDYVIIRDKY